MKVTKPESISEEHLNFQPADEMQTIAFVVDDEMTYIYISLIQTLSAIVDGRAGELLTRSITVANNEKLEYKLDDDIFLVAIIKHMLDGNARVVGKNLHLDDGNYIIPNYVNKLEREKFVKGVITTEDESYEIFL